MKKIFSIFTVLSITTSAMADITPNTNVATTSYVQGAVATKQDVIDVSHKLSADLVDDTSTTNKFVTASDKTAWNAKLSTVTVDNTGVSTNNPAPVVTNVSASNGTVTVTRQDLAVPIKSSGSYTVNSAVIWLE